MEVDGSGRVVIDELIEGVPVPQGGAAGGAGGGVVASEDEEEDRGDVNSQAVAVAAVGGDATTYVWETGYESTWTQTLKAAGDKNKKDFVMLFERATTEQEPTSTDLTTSIRWAQLHVDGKGRLERPYLGEYKTTKRDPHMHALRSNSRYLVLLIDFSEMMTEADIKPTRLACTLEILEETFIAPFFEHNPISHLAIVALANKAGFVLSNFYSGGPLHHSEKMRCFQAEVRNGLLGGEISIQNGLERAILLLKETPIYGSREILCVNGSTYTVDASMLNSTQVALKKLNIQFSVVSLAPEMYILKSLSVETGGVFGVPVNKNHFVNLMKQHLLPKSRREGTAVVLVACGFPQKVKTSVLSLCFCHNQLGFTGFICPRCHAKNCELSTTCASCCLTMMSVTDIARCHGNSQIPPPFIPLPTGEGMCSLCLRKFVSGGGQCPNCCSMTCFDCDLFCHEVLRLCPNCARMIDPPDLSKRAVLPPNYRDYDTYKLIIQDCDKQRQGQS